MRKGMPLIFGSHSSVKTKLSGDTSPIVVLLLDSPREFSLLFNRDLTNLWRLNQSTKETDRQQSTVIRCGVGCNWVTP